ncbi:unnamed protein product [Bathycoccus prasinos]|jgi:hypothetical protein
MTTRIRDELERSWPKNNNEMRMTPLRALAENAKRVLAETKKFLDIKDDEKDDEESIIIDREMLKEIERLAEEMRSETEDVELSFYYGDEEEEEDAVSSSSSSPRERKKRNEFAEKFLGGCFPGGVEVKKNVSRRSATAAAAVRIRVFDRFSSSSSSSEEEEKWMTDAIEFVEKARKSNAFLIIENCETEEKAREIRAELYSGAMAFSAKRSEEEEFVFCLEGGIVLEDEEKGANATSIQGGEEKKENGKNKKNQDGGLFASGSEDSDSLSSDEEDVARIERLSINNINDRDIATCKRAQANISNAFRAMCLERAERYALRYAPMRERIYAKLKEKAKAKKKEEKEKKNNQQKRFDESNDEPVRMPANASSPLVKKSNFQIIENYNELASAKKDGGPGVMSFLDWMGGDGNDEVPLSEQKGISYQSKADAARIKALEAALRELNPDHPLLMFCPAPKT